MSLLFYCKLPEKLSQYMYEHICCFDLQAFQEETQGKGVCLEFIETVHRETIVSDARRVALTIQASTARVILIFCLVYRCEDNYCWNWRREK